VYLPIGVISHSYREFADYQAGADASLSVNLVARLRFGEFSDDFAVHALRDRVVATPCKLSHHGRFFYGCCCCCCGCFIARVNIILVLIAAAGICVPHGREYL